MDYKIMNFIYRLPFKIFSTKTYYLKMARFADSLSNWAWTNYRKNNTNQAISACEVAKYTQDVWTKNHHIVVDEPKNIGGYNKGATPFELLQAALASCTVITLRMYCEKKAINIEHLSVDVTKETITTTIEGSKKPNISQLYNIKINIKGVVSEKDKKRLARIATKCPVHLALKNTPQFKINIS